MAHEEKIECVTSAWGWVGIIAIPLAFWVFIVAFAVTVFGGRRGTAEQLEPVAIDEPIADLVRDLTRLSSGLAWRPPVPSHH